MLPPDLLRIAALHVNSDALAKSVVFTFQSDRVVDIWIGRSIVHVKHMTSYAELDRVLLGETTSFPVAPDTLRAVLDKAQQLRLERLARGGLSLPHTWLEFDLDDKKRPTNVHCSQMQNRSHMCWWMSFVSEPTRPWRTAWPPRLRIMRCWSDKMFRPKELGIHL